MSTHDVPGANPANGDDLHAGCWAEHDDGSLIFVEGAEGGRVIYSVFDMAQDPPIEYRDAMPEKVFKKTFTADGSKPDMVWTWHDKTPFPWDRVIKKGIKDGVRLPSADDIKTAAQRVAESLKLRAGEIVTDDKHGHRKDKTLKKAAKMLKKLARALEGDDAEERA